MNYEEKWVRWEPVVKGLNSNYHFNAIYDEEDELSILITGIKVVTVVKITFENSVWAYKRTSESFRQNLFRDLSRQYGDDFYTKWSFFRVENSSYLKWLSEQSNTLTDHLKLIHFVIMTIDDIIDVVANCEPVVKIIE